jgi:hypothetical protein
VVDWRPLEGSLFPALRGRIVVWPGGVREPAYLEFQAICDGSDDGPAYDATIGRLIAERAALGFLEDAAAAVHASGARVRA